MPIQIRKPVAWGLSTHSSHTAAPQQPQMPAPTLPPTKQAEKPPMAAPVPPTGMVFAKHNPSAMADVEPVKEDPFQPNAAEDGLKALETVDLPPRNGKSAWNTPATDRVGQWVVGEDVQITNMLYHWVDYWKPGDTGTITRCWPAPTDGSVTEREKYHLLEVKLHNPSHAGREVCTFHAWELVKWQSVSGS